MVENLLKVESVCIGVDKKMRDVSFDYDDDDDNDDLYLCDEGWVEKWVCEELRRLSISDFWAQSCWRRSSLLSLLSRSC
uniref:Uncharacterized protein n=1 Tax=Tanacetum cinerariifolium TaxID=118510 RepID=A0A699GX13_TANCI|nr:hypothetical protein [Tanacetum cinerariifolium]